MGTTLDTHIYPNGSGSITGSLNSYTKGTCTVCTPGFESTNPMARVKGQGEGESVKEGEDEEDVKPNPS